MVWPILKNRLIALCIALIVGCALPSAAICQELNVDLSSSNYGPDQGLPSSELYRIIQDKKGYLWIASDNGVTRFDGNRFKHYSTEQGLIDNVVLHLAELNDGSILCATLSNRLYVLKSDSVFPFKNEFIFRNQINSEEIPNDLHVWDNGTVGLGVNSSGTSLLTEEGKIIPGFKNEGKGIWVSELNQEVIAGIWTTELEFSTGFTIVYSKDGQLKSFEIAQEDLIYGPSRATLFEGSLVVSNGNNLYSIDKEGKVNTTRLKTTIYCLNSSANHGLLVGTSQKGIHQYKSLQDLWQGNADNWLSSTSVTDLLTIDGGGIWASSLDNGLYFIPSPDITCTSFSEGLIGITKNNNEILAIGRHSGYFYGTSISSVDWQKKGYPPIPDAAGLHFDEKHNVLYSYAKGLKYYENGAWHPVRDKHDEPFVGILKLHDGQGDHLWASGRHNFDLIDKSSKSVIQINSNKKFNHRVICVFEDRNNKLWISTSDGFFHGDKNKLDQIEKIGSTPIVGRIEAIVAISKDLVAFGIKGQGVVIYNIITKESQVIDTSNGLVSSIIETLASDGEEQLFVGSTSGVQRLLINNNSIYKIQNIDKSTGLLTNDVNQLEYSNGILFVLSPKGVTTINEWSENETEPQILISRIVSGNKSYSADDNIELNYPDNGLKIEYTGFQYYHPSQLKFRYRILSDDSIWHETRSNALNISDLNSGKYHIQIQAGVEQKWSASDDIQFKVIGPYWSSWWFISIVFIIAFAFMYFGLKWLLLRLRKGDIIEKKLVYLERSALLSQMNPHFIFNSLNSIQSYIANNENDKANRFLAKFSRLIRAMLNHSRSAKVTLQEEIDSLTLYLDMEKMRFKEKFTYSITVDDEIDSHDIELPPMLIQPYLENAIIHGLAKKGGQGRIELFYLLHGNYLVVTVTDNGIGIEQSRKQKEGFAISLHKSVGMTITQKRLELLDDDKDDKKVKIEEVKDREGKVLGTKVEVKIKVY